MAYNTPKLGTIQNMMVPSISAVTMPNGVPTNIASLLLDPGSYILSGNAVFNGAVTVIGTQRLLISSSSGTIGIVGDNSIIGLINSLNLSGSDVTLSLPAYMVQVLTPTTFYLVGQISYTLGTAKAYGKLSSFQLPV